MPDQKSCATQRNQAHPQEEEPMQDSTTPRSRSKSAGIKLALVGGGVAAGAIVATAIGANAATNSGSAVAPSTSSSSSAQAGTPDHGSRGGRGDEKSLDAATTAKIKAAALKAVPGGTVDRVESDSGDATYEAHMTKSDGTKVTVKFDKNLKISGVEAGMGR
jgi:uncharacterized membrane protein YkoI